MSVVDNDREESLAARWRGGEPEGTRNLGGVRYPESQIPDLADVLDPVTGQPG